MIYVWAYEQEHKKFQQQDVFVKWNLQDTYTKNKEAKAETSSFIETGIRDDEKLTTVYHRYYHMFRQGEMETLINENFIDRFEIKDSFFDHANWVVVIQKIA